MQDKRGANPSSFTVVPQSRGDAPFITVILPSQPVVPFLQLGSIPQLPSGSTFQVIACANNENGAASLIATEDKRERRKIAIPRRAYSKVLDEFSTASCSGVGRSGTALKKMPALDLDVTDYEDQDNGAISATLDDVQCTPSGLLKSSKLNTTADLSNDIQSIFQALVMENNGNTSSPFIHCVQKQDELTSVPGSKLASTSAQSDDIQGASQTLTAKNAGYSIDINDTVIQCLKAEDGQIFIPMNIPLADLQASQHQAKTGAVRSNCRAKREDIVPNIEDDEDEQIIDIESKRDEIRRKNRLAAKESRKRKKRYIEDLEQKVLELENEKESIIKKLRELKKKYCIDTHDTD